MPEIQNTIIYLMLLNGILFLSLNFVAHSIIFPEPKGSKKFGYTLIVTVISAFSVQQAFRAFISLDFDPQHATKVLLGGFIVPVFLVSLVYFRIRRNREESSSREPPPAKKKSENH